MRRLADEFWEWSCAAYARPGVREACLQLQDAHGADVNLALFCLWWGRQGVQLTAEDCRRLAEATAPMRELITPLRALSRALRDCPLPEAAPLRRTLLALELEVERRAQRRLVAVAGREQQLGLAAGPDHNLAVYLDGLGLADATARAAGLAAAAG